jgi:hypothetical protein
MKNKLIIIILLSVKNCFSQIKIGGSFKQFDEINSRWYFSQKILYKAKKNNITETLYFKLDSDLNNDGIPDFGKVQFFRLNTPNNSKLIKLATIPLGETNEHEKYLGSEIGIYQDYFNTFNLYNNDIIYTPIEASMFYRQSKILPTNMTLRILESKPILLQAPVNYLDLPERNCLVQLVYTIRLADYKSYNSIQSNDYSFWPVNDNNDFRGLFLDKDRYVLNTADNSFLKSKDIFTTKSIIWGEEYFSETTILNIILSW